MPAYVYFLKSQRNGKYYIGSTSDIERRVVEHNRGQTKSTKYLRPWLLAFQQQFSNITTAKRIETKLKKFKSKVILDEIIETGIIK